MIRNAIASAVLITLTALFALTLAHDIRPISEDMTVVWVCSINGNRICGPDQGPIMINPANLLNW